jgi:hypothetical protein
MSADLKKLSKGKQQLKDLIKEAPQRCHIDEKDGINCPNFERVAHQPLRFCSMFRRKPESTLRARKRPPSCLTSSMIRTVQITCSPRTSLTTSLRRCLKCSGRQSLIDQSINLNSIKAAMSQDEQKPSSKHLEAPKSALLDKSAEKADKSRSPRVRFSHQPTSINKSYGKNPDSSAKVHKSPTKEPQEESKVAEQPLSKSGSKEERVSRSDSKN